MPETVVCERGDRRDGCRPGVLARRRRHQADFRLDGPWHRARQRSRRRVSRRPGARADAVGVLRAARRRSRRPRRPRCSSSAAGCSGRSSARAPAGDWRSNVARGGTARAIRPAAEPGSGSRIRRRCGGRRRLRRRRPAAGAATAESSCSRSTASRAGRACSARPASTSPARSSSTCSRARSAAHGRETSLTGAVPRDDRGDVAAAAQLACLLEVSAPKPGNVSPGRHFADIALRGLPGQRRGDRRAAGGGRHAPAGCDDPPAPSKRPPDGRARTPTSASCCCSRRSPAPPGSQAWRRVTGRAARHQGCTRYVRQSGACSRQRPSTMHATCMRRSGLPRPGGLGRADRRTLPASRR